MIFRVLTLTCVPNRKCSSAHAQRGHLLLLCSMALVPYVQNPNPALSKLHSSSAEFRFVGRDLRLQQDWKRLGVAAVVWDAVSMCV